MGFFIRSTIFKYVEEIKGISKRIALLKLKVSSNIKMLVMLVYAPTSAASEEELQTFYNTVELTSAENKEY